MRNTFFVVMSVYMVFLLGIPSLLEACSTFKLEKAKGLVYGHNLNERDIGVPGWIFINKRGVFKIGRSWEDLITKEKGETSSFSWISRYGSVTFNVFGKGLPDGGMNETGLFIWEMNEKAEYPKGNGRPKLNQMTWMQYVLDQCRTVEEAIEMAGSVEIDGWGWHYFVGDGTGNCAAIAFADGKPVVYQNENFPIPGLFNTPYDRELEILKYYRGFGGVYEADLSDPNVPRIVKTAVLLRDFREERDVVDYGLMMLDRLKVNDVPEWSVLFDVLNEKVYYKTRLNSEMKYFNFRDIDFSNSKGTLVLDLDSPVKENVIENFSPYHKKDFYRFTSSRLFPILPSNFFTSGGLSKEEYLERFSSLGEDAETEKNHFFKGVWEFRDMENKKIQFLQVDLTAEKSSVSGNVSFKEDLRDLYPIDHIFLKNDSLNLTFKNKNKAFFEIKGLIKKDSMLVRLLGIEDDYGNFILKKKK